MIISDCECPNGNHIGEVIRLTLNEKLFAVLLFNRGLDLINLVHRELNFRQSLMPLLRTSPITYSLSEQIFNIKNMIHSLNLDAASNLQNLNIPCESCRVNLINHSNYVKSELDMILHRYSDLIIRAFEPYFVANNYACFGVNCVHCLYMSFKGE